MMHRQQQQQGCQLRVDVPAQRPLKTSPKVAQLVPSSELTVCLIVGYANSSVTVMLVYFGLFVNDFQLIYGFYGP